MKLLCMDSAPRLVVLSAIALASTGVCGASAYSPVSATVIAGAYVDVGVGVAQTSPFFSSVTGDVIIRLPGTGPLGAFDDDLSQSASTRSALVDASCLRKAINLGDCLGLTALSGLLRGDPVSDILLESMDSSSWNENSVSVTVVYN
ncbi:hypothetical protein [Marinobacter sp.]|uniref:hypothetical protein n=1 Tax=Marinobacter sp. TaxID=50741 RepID=UPI003A911BB9